jgi:protein phosphatase
MTRAWNFAVDPSDLPDDFDPQSTASACGATHCGQVRDSNQDHFLIAQLNKSMRITATSMPLDDRLYGCVQGEVLLVADGMGGHAAGEKASHLAIEHFIRRLLSSIHWHFHGDDEREPEFIEDLQHLLRDAHSRILTEGELHVDQRGMGTTLTSAYIVWPRMYVVHAGDTRCYLIRDGKSNQITTDHTLARQMVEAGGLSPEDEASSKWSNVLWNVLGGQTEGGDIMAEVRRVDLMEGDRVVLCSDGLHRYLSDQQLVDLIADTDQPDQACQRCIDFANNAGGEDNVTVIVSMPKSGDTTQTTWIEELETEPGTSASDMEIDAIADTDEIDLQIGDRDVVGEDDFVSGVVDPLSDTLLE